MVLRDSKVYQIVLHKQINPDNTTASVLPDLSKWCRGPSCLKLGDLNHNWTPYQKWLDFQYV